MKPREVPRPLDRAGTIKIKLGLLVAVSVTATALVLWYGLLYLGWLPQYTLPAAVVLALVLTQVLAHGMTSPLREMTEAVRAMARGDYSRRVAATSWDEVGQLARAFNQMAAELAEVDKARRELVANVSHELRTPISALRAVLDNVVDGVAEPDPATMRAALAQTERLSRLVGHLLDLSRLESGVVPLNRAEFAVRPLLAAAVAEAAVAGRPVTIEVEVTPAGLTAAADPERLHQVVANLLDNACRHSPAGGTVTVTARPGPGPGSLWLEVADEGPGIPKADRGRVFERFHRGGSAQAGDGGTGLGLAIARWVVDLHAGRIAVAGDGRGCRIQVALPGHDGSIEETAADDGEDEVADKVADEVADEVVGRPAGPVHVGEAFGGLSRLWPGPDRTAPVPVMAGAAATGLLGAFCVFPADAPGVGVFGVGLAAAAATWPAARPRRSRPMLAYGTLALALLATVFLRQAPGLVALCMLAAFAFASLALAGSATGRSDGRGGLTVLAGGVTVALAGLRMPPWAIRSLASPGGANGERVWRILRAAGIGAVLLAVFSALFASADAAFRDLAEAALPDLSFADIPQRVVAFALTSGLALAAAYVAMAPPRWSQLPARPGREWRRAEWMLPIVALDALFAVFAAVQFTVLFGGHERILHGSGMTYAEYARAGFFQLVAATALTLAVVAWAVGRAPRQSATDRRVVRLLLGALCLLTLVVVASALRRLALYEDAYGLTVARMFAAAIELWLGLIVVFVLVGGVRLRGAWVPHAVVASGAAVLLALVALDPDGFVAARNVDRFERTGKIDLLYAGELSADAVPALSRLPEPLRSCALAPHAMRLAGETPWYAANVALTRAHRTLHDHPLEQPAADCPLLR